MNIGNKVYYVDLNLKKVGEGVIVGNGISTTGYLVNDIKMASGIVTKEQAFIFTNYKVAKEALERFLPIADEMQKMKERTATELDKKRREILGEPEFKHLVSAKDKK